MDGHSALGRGIAALATALALAPAAAQAQLPAEDAATLRAEPGSAEASKRGLSESRLRKGLTQKMRSAGGSSGAWVFNIDAPHQGAIYSRNGGSRRILASNTKLFTTAAMLDRFGADGRLATTTYGRGERIGAGGEILDGDLVVVGDGDPALSSAGFARRNHLPNTSLGELVADVRAAGIEVVRGDLRVDDTVFDRQRRSGPYLSPLSGLSYNSGHSPGGGYARSPELVAGRALKQRLRNAHVKVRGGVRRANLPDSVLATEPLGVATSPTVRSLLDETNKPSNNFFAEMLLKRVGARPGKKGTTRRGANRVEDFAASLGASAQLRDGSGLSRANRAAPKELGRVLVEMSQRPDGEAYRRSLPLAGREGTVAGRMRGTAAEGNCRTKTGTISGVSALSGYCDAGPDRIAFSILMNGVDTTRARSAQDGMASMIARYRR
jgi:D-alanyl-D-alanine carboxypeptidase/D-alanyl-D-alanine-endopeptidase (penicillin-binding protein 4)